MDNDATAAELGLTVNNWCEGIGSIRACFLEGDSFFSGSSVKADEVRCEIRHIGYDNCCF